MDDAVHPTAEVDQRQGDTRLGEQILKCDAGRVPATLRERGCRAYDS